MRVAVAQIASHPSDLDANLRKHLDVIDAARADGVEVLLFPEMSLTGHGAGADTLSLAIGRDHPHVTAIAQASGRMCTVFGLIEERPAAQFHNSAFIVRGGDVIFVHRKINLATYGRLEDGKHFGAGRSVDTCDVDDRWRASVMICADCWNPSLVHLAALRGTTLLLAPVSSALEAVGAEFDNPRGWEVNLAFYAMTYGMPVMMANRVGNEGELTFWGGSRILDPFGSALVQAAGDEETLLRATLDYDRLRKARYLLPTVRDANLPLLQQEIERIASEGRS
ncbi:MAG TPA: nitrilase-related carbon-nitrogen hydrolase [Casimicrobiaceae bacterium]|nr:nitrilase-related carbon-nitrogen hydrolase [Casimicrobiaceae bacterium]